MRSVSEPGDKLTRAYRDLSREEPTPALDRAILAASQRALRRPSLARRWAAPVSIAAMLVLAIGVTLEMQHEQPGIETSAPQRGAIPPRAVEPQPAPLPQAQAPVTPEPQPKLKREPVAPPPATAPRAKREAIAPPREAIAPAREASPRIEAAPERIAPATPPMQAPAAAAGAAAAPAPAAADMQAPAASNVARPQALRAAPAVAKELRAQSEEERELERIATLRAQGRDTEADKALQEFRRAHPDYRIPDTIWERVKPR